MEEESSVKEYKSIQKIRTGESGFKALAGTCVALANAQGGIIYIGIEDKTKRPAKNQKIEQKEVNEAVTKLRSLCFNVSLTNTEIKSDKEGNEYFCLLVSPSFKSIATTSDGKIYMRVADKCEPVRSEDLQRLMEEKGSFQWELIASKFSLDEYSKIKLSKFSEKIRKSDRVSAHIKQMSDMEIAENYNLIEEKRLTNLGTLWIGTAAQRCRLNYPITVQYIVYDSAETKIRKKDWHDNLLTPEELLIDIEKEAVELTYSYEIPDGLFRKTVRHYRQKVVRELLVNAFAHHCFTISNDIMIQVYPDRLEISSPGGLPLGITQNNILHQQYRRNPQFIRIMHDLGLMEGEGSGYDLIYELNALDAKLIPEVVSEFGSTTVIQYSKITDESLLPLLDFVDKHYVLSQKAKIALGLIAQNQKILSSDLTLLLQLPTHERMRDYVEPLLAQGLIVKRGLKKGTEFLVNPQLIMNAHLNKNTTLKTIEPHTLTALIKEDLRLHPNSKMAEIASRLKDVDKRDVLKYIYGMVKTSEVLSSGAKRNRVYSLAKKK
jgi:ATP-dependent DNA helicase RecG